MPTQLLTGERAITTARQHWSVTVPAVFVAVVVIVAVSVLMALTPSVVEGSNIAAIKGTIELITILLTLIVVGVKLLQWRSATFTLTSRRIVVSRGVVSKVTESIALDRIQDTTVRKPLAERMIHTGDIEIESAGRDGVEMLHRIPRPDAFYNDLLQAIEEHRTGVASSAPTASLPSPPPPPPPPPSSTGGL
ncbi:MAG: PH domain-containing protein [Candidatus Dormibacteria bacterium]